MRNTPEAWGRRATVNDPWKACLWSKDSQRERLKQLVATVEPRPDERLLDFGCGTGELTRYLPAYTVYHGVDWSDGMIRRAREDHPGYRFDLSPEGTYGVTVCAGTFNLCHNWSKQQTWDTLKSLLGVTRRILAVSLNTREDPRNLDYQEVELRAFADSVSGDWRMEWWFTGDVILSLR